MVAGSINIINIEGVSGGVVTAGVVNSSQNVLARTGVGVDEALLVVKFYAIIYIYKYSNIILFFLSIIKKF